MNRMTASTAGGAASDHTINNIDRRTKMDLHAACRFVHRYHRLAIEIALQRPGGSRGTSEEILRTLYRPEPDGTG